jgi:hypothetical protein
VEMVRSSDVSASQIASELGINPNMLLRNRQICLNNGKRPRATPFGLYFV